ncbi:MAG TPA: alpha/beta family hydrolase [Gammaproteobacteria bacterium]|nr:alpha/beta family hydrolase [Gammaproteobacteria bacterium]
MGLYKADIKIPIDDIHLNGILQIPQHAKSIVLFAHGSGSGRLSVRNQHVAGLLNNANIATLLFDLLTENEEQVDDMTREHRFNISLLASRLISVTDWLSKQPETENLIVGYFGASTGGGAALQAAAKKQNSVKAVVSRGGRPDLAGTALAHVKAPTLLIVGGLDEPVIEMNRDAMNEMHCIKKLDIIPGATHLFEEPGTLDEVARLAKEWFIDYLK